MDDAFDLPAYLARIGVTDAGAADLPTLKRLHRAHIAAIPFENLDIQLGRAIELDAASLQAALVARRRGGYCFQQNGLFRLVLTALGYTVGPREARVRLGASSPMLPRTHMVLIVPLDGVDWLADVGFGGDGIVEPIRADGSAAIQDGWTYRVITEQRLRLLQRLGANGWDDLYAFADNDVLPVDYVVGNWYTSTYPQSAFVRNLTAQRTVGDVRHILRNLTYSVAKAGGEWQTRTILREELVPLLRDVFGLDIPLDARFRALDGPV